jgi:hypothetical protein
MAACSVSEKRRRATRGTAALVRKAGLRDSMLERTMVEGEGGAERRQERDETRCARRRGADDENHTQRTECVHGGTTQRIVIGEKTDK